ncbi:MAG: trimethylamine methyltransferase family protein [Lentisphaerae bacterium]|nr:trimethylamine methyltransferase family protein [Lentisphaerota bacterium]
MMEVFERLAARRGDDGFVVLKRADVLKIDAAARRLVEELGFKVGHPVVLDMLRRRGYRVDGDVVHVHEAALDVLIRNIPKVPEPRRAATGGVRVGYFANQIYDADADVVRYPTRADLDRATIVGLSLPEVTEVTALFEPKDVPGYEDVLMLDVMLRRVKTPTRCDILSRHSIPLMLRMCDIAYGSREEVLRRRVLMQHAFITSPLTYDHDTLDFALAALAEGIWVRCGATMCVAGVSAPVTLAGTLTMSLAEVYTGLVMSDLFGQPWEPGIAPIVMDQRTGASLYCGPDRTLLSLASRDLYRHIGVDMGPMGSIGHLTSSDACKPGIQAGMEKAYTAMLNVLAGVPPYISHGGGLGPGGLVGSLEQIVIDCELMSILNRLVTGIDVNDDTIALDLMLQLGFGGGYMSESHTAEHFRKELWLPRIIKRLNPSAWNDEKPDMLGEARKKVKEILATQDPRALDPRQEKDLDAVVGGIGGRGRGAR